LACFHPFFYAKDIIKYFQVTIEQKSSLSPFMGAPNFVGVRVYWRPISTKQNKTVFLMLGVKEPDCNPSPRLSITCHFTFGIVAP